MMSTGDAKIREEAASWFIRQRDPVQADWDGFLAWLEADPAHNEAYEAVALADGEIEELIADSRGAPAPSNDNIDAPTRIGRRFALGGVLAVVLAGFVAYPMLGPVTATYAVETSAGQHRLVTLDDGTRIELNGDTKLSLRKGDSRFASLDKGEATFTVVHDADAPFEVRAGDVTLRDVGTVFNVVRSADGTEAAVAEGSVMFNPDSEAVLLDTGKLMRISRDGTATVSKVDPASVGAWRADRLVYQDAPFSRIAADLSRNLGTDVVVAPQLARQRFSGIILLGKDHSQLFARIGALLDVDAERVDGAWHLTPRKRARR